MSQPSYGTRAGRLHVLSYKLLYSLLFAVFRRYSPIRADEKQLGLGIVPPYILKGEYHHIAPFEQIESPNEQNCPWICQLRASVDCRTLSGGIRNNSSMLQGEIVKGTRAVEYALARCSHTRCVRDSSAFGRNTSFKLSISSYAVSRPGQKPRAMEPDYHRNV